MIFSCILIILFIYTKPGGPILDKKGEMLVPPVDGCDENFLARDENTEEPSISDQTTRANDSQEPLDPKLAQFIQEQKKTN